MVYQLTAPAELPIPPSPFSVLPGAAPGMLIWLLAAAAAVLYFAGLRPRRASPRVEAAIPLWLATAIYSGLFLNLYLLVDEVMINLEHPYNLHHFGRFSMSATGWVDGTVELIFYLIHSPFGGSQRSLVLANFAISFLAGWAHLPLASRLLPAGAGTGMRTAFLCGFALYSPLVAIFSSGFGNGLVSLAFLAAVAAAAEGRTGRSLFLSGLLPLLRPDAVLVSAANIAVLAFRRSIRRRELALAALPLVSMAIYYACYRFLYGHWVPVPVRFKALTPAMLGMTDWAGLIQKLLFYVVHPAHLAGLTAVALWLRGGRSRTLNLLVGYALSTLPILLFYHFTRATVGDFSFETYARYWVAFELVFALLTLAALAGLVEGPGGAPAGSRVLLAVLLAAGALLSGSVTLKGDRGREDSAFAGGFTERYLPTRLSLSTSEMNTFGFMVDRPIVDLWGYSTPEIATSHTCNQDHIRNNPGFFLQREPDVYWPYWFTRSLDPARTRGDFDSAEISLATYHHTSRRGNLLGDMRSVLNKYDVVVIDFPDRKKTDRIGYLIRKPEVAGMLAELASRGIRKVRERPIDWPAFERSYGRMEPAPLRCD